MLEVSKVGTESTLDFLLHRSPTYIYQITFGALHEFSRRVAGKHRGRLIGDAQLYHVIMNTGFTAGLEPPDKGEQRPRAVVFLCTRKSRTQCRFLASVCLRGSLCCWANPLQLQSWQRITEPQLILFFISLFTKKI